MPASTGCHGVPGLTWHQLLHHPAVETLTWSTLRTRRQEYRNSCDHRGRKDTPSHEEKRKKKNTCISISIVFIACIVMILWLRVVAMLAMKLAFGRLQQPLTVLKVEHYQNQKQLCSAWCCDSPNFCSQHELQNRIDPFYGDAGRQFQDIPVLLDDCYGEKIWRWENPREKARIAM